MHSGSAAVLGLAAQWSFWAMLETEALLLDLLAHRIMLAEYARDPSHIERNTLLLQKPLAVLEGALNGRDHLAGENFTVADLNVASILAWGKIAGLDFSPHPNVARWLEKSLARPAYKRMWGLRNEPCVKAWKFLPPPAFRGSCARAALPKVMANAYTGEPCLAPASESGRQGQSWTEPCHDPQCYVS
jgi:glutathione S-transferase-like protein